MRQTAPWCDGLGKFCDGAGLLRAGFVGPWLGKLAASPPAAVQAGLHIYQHTLWGHSKAELTGKEATYQQWAFNRTTLQSAQTSAIEMTTAWQ